MTAPTPITKQNPLKGAQARMISELLAIAVPSPSDPAGIAKLITEVAQTLDGWLGAIGSEVRDTAVTSIGSHLFNGTFFAAVDGNEIYAACEQQVEAARDDAEERRLRRHG